MKYEEFKELVINEAKAQELEEYELYYSTSESVEISTFRHEINEFSASNEGGVCVRALSGGQMGYASTEELNAEEARAIVSRAVENAGVLESAEKVFLGEAGGVYEKPEKKEYALPGTDELIQTALESQKIAYAADPQVVDGTSSTVINIKQQVAIFNSRGLDLSCENAATAYFVVAVVSDGNEMNDSFEVKFGPLSELKTEELVGKAVEDAKKKLGAGVAPTGAYPVVFAPRAMAALLGTFASVFSAEAAQKGLSLLAGREGEAIAAPCVTLTDDPFYAESPVQLSFDAEGMPTSRKALIEDGTLKTLLHNLKTAAVAGVKTTGNASKSNYAASVGISPFTLVLKPGDLTEEELLAKAGNGVWIDMLQGMHAGANPISGDFSLQSGGFMIENGKKTEAVKAFTVAGNFFDLLKHVEALSDQAEFNGMSTDSAYASPAVLVSGLSIAGK